VVKGPTRTHPVERAVPGGREIDEQTGVGEAYMGSLMRTQLRLALKVLAMVLVPLALLPLIFAAFPLIAELMVGPVPLPWLILGVGVYPVLVFVGWRFIRQVERNEAEFERIVSQR
jgi:hypothetical protein